MPIFDATRGACRVFTYKDGLLGAVAHDLELEVGAFEIRLADDGAVDATFEVRSIRVVDAIVDGRRAPGALSARDKRKIESNLVSDVIRAKRHPRVAFRGRVDREGDGAVARGELTIAGRSRRVELPIVRDGDRARLEHRIHQPDYGIRPFSAMLGTLKIKPDVRVTLDVPWV